MERTVLNKELKIGSVIEVKEGNLIPFDFEGIDEEDLDFIREYVRDEYTNNGTVSCLKVSYDEGGLFIILNELKKDILFDTICEWEVALKKYANGELKKNWEILNWEEEFSMVLTKENYYEWCQLWLEYNILTYGDYFLFNIKE